MFDNVIALSTRWWVKSGFESALFSRGDNNREVVKRVGVGRSVEEEKEEKEVEEEEEEERMETKPIKVLPLLRNRNRARLSSFQLEFRCLLIDSTRTPALNTQIYLLRITLCEKFQTST